MKHLLKKVNDLLEREYELPVPKKKQQAPKQPPTPKHRPGYVNPFKHQQELQERIKTQPIQPKRPTIPQLSQSPKSPPSPKFVPPKLPTLPKPKMPSLFDRKFEITIKKPKFKKPPLPKVQLNLPEKKLPEIPVQSIKKPEVKLPPISVKKPEVTLPKLPKPKLHKPPRLSKKHSYIFASLIVSGVILGGMVMGGLSNPFSTPPAKTSTSEQAVEGNPAIKVAEAVSKKTTLPKGEEPESATITDPKDLPDQDFFKDAKAGDKILMYKKSKKAYLYRPSTDQVLTVAELDFQDQEVAGAATTPAVDATPEPTQVPITKPGGKMLINTTE